MPVAPTYPDIEVGDLVTADLLTSMQPGIVVKPSATARSTTTTPAADPDLAAITLGVGTWEVELTLFFNCATTATQGIRTQWGFSGSWNTPVRWTLGPGATGTANATSSDVVNLGGATTAANNIYAVAAGATYACVREVCYTVVVTIAGDLSLLWSQNVSSANATTVQGGSAFKVRQIA